MNAREKFLRTMEFDISVPPPLYEMGWWIGTIRRWYNEGLPKIQGIPEDLPSGESVRGPLMGGKRKCTDPGAVVNFDKGSEKLPLEHWIFPEFKPQILQELGDRLVVIDEMGIKKKISRENDSIPEYYEWPVKNRDDWEKFKDQRLNLKTPGRYPENLEEVIETFENRDYPLSIGELPVGFFGSVRYLMGEVKLFTSYYDDPELVKQIINDLVDFWIELWRPVLSRMEVDWVNMWEDMCYKTGPLVSPQIFREFMLPAYQRFTSFLREMGVKHIIVDTDGNCWELIPLFLEGGATGLFPMEVAAGMNVVEVRKQYPDLQIMGGIDKRVLISGKKEIDEELETKIPFMLKKGGYIPHVDHHIPPDVPLENFIYYRNQLEEMIDKSQMWKK